MLLLLVPLDCRRSSFPVDSRLGLFSRYQFTSASGSNKKLNAHFIFFPKRIEMILKAALYYD